MNSGESFEGAGEDHRAWMAGFFSKALTSILICNVETTEIGLDNAPYLSRLDPLLYGFHGVRAQLFMQSGDFQSATRYLEKVATTPSAHHLIEIIALAAHSLDLRHDKAARWCKEARRCKADATAAHYFAAFQTRNAYTASRIAAELRRHGF